MASGRHSEARKEGRTQVRGFGNEELPVNPGISFYRMGWGGRRPPPDFHG